MPEAKHIDGEKLLATVLDNMRANHADPEGYSAWEAERNKDATPMEFDGEIPKAPPLNDDGSEQEEEPAGDGQQALQESWLLIPDSVLDLLTEDVDLMEGAEPGFTGEITDSMGRRIRFVNGKRVHRSAFDNTERTFRARLDGEKVHVISHDPDKGLVVIRDGSGKKQVVRIQDLDLHRGVKAEGSVPPVYNPNPHAVNEHTGLADKARVGVPAMSVPPPPQEIGRLPNLDPRQRKAEKRFAEAYLKDPDGLAQKYLKALKKRKVGEYPNVFATDDVKMLNPDWNPAGAGNLSENLPNKVKKAMAQHNAAVHQTANAIAKRAFLTYLDEVVAKLPEDKRTVLVTNGGCSAGKGSSVKRATDPKDPHFGMLPAAEQVGAIWDAAGEQNATENEWVFQECQKLGIKPIFAYVWADPKASWDGEDRGVIRRALRKGRMVDARLFADSYAVGAKNMKAFVDKHDDADFIFLDNRDKKAPKVMDHFPEETLKWDAEEIYRDAVKVLQERKDELGRAILAGGLGGTKIWGTPR